MTLRILFDAPSDREEHARNLVARLEEADEKHPQDVLPRGVAVALARYMNVCDECEKPYWSASKWASHIGCKGSLKSGVGF